MRTETVDIDELVTALRGGQPWAAPALVTMVTPALLGYATMHGGGLSTTDREAAVEAAITRAAAKIDKYQKSKGPFTAWLRPFVRHALEDIRRQQPGAPASLPEDMPQDVVDDQEYQSEQKAGRAEAVRNAVRRLSKTDQLIITLRFTERLSYEQCAELIGDVTAGACRVRLHRALQRLMGQAKAEAALSQYFEEELK
jgi:RNA polymerase sigma factor (sigma-70 family)